MDLADDVDPHLVRFGGPAQRQFLPAVCPVPEPVPRQLAAAGQSNRACDDGGLSRALLASSESPHRELSVESRSYRIRRCFESIGSGISRLAGSGASQTADDHGHKQPVHRPPPWDGALRGKRSTGRLSVSAAGPKFLGYGSGYSVFGGWPRAPQRLRFSWSGASL